MKSSLKLALAASLLASVASAQLVTYNTDLASPNIGAVSSFAANVSATAFSLNNVTLGRVQVSGVDHAATINPTIAQASVDVAATLANATYFSITLTPQAGYELDLTSISFEANAGGASSPRGFHLFSSVTGFTGATVLSQANNGGGGGLTNRPTQTAFSVDLTSGTFAGGGSYSATLFQNITGTTEFRFYVQADATSKSIDFDNIVINGTVSAVSIPEPASFATLAGAGLLGFAALRRRRR